TGAVCGFLNGWISTRWKIPSFIVTLGMLNMAAGAARVVSDNSTITGLPQSFVDFGNLIIGGFLPSIFLVAVLVIAAGWFGGDSVPGCVRTAVFPSPSAQQTESANGHSS
ncbi:hypothetical protein EN785_36115, partial [Mesorhizobium sp. M8A.F.Ca.ET.142.01.1.1]